MDRPPEALISASLRQFILRDPLLGGLVRQLFHHCIPLTDDRRPDAIALAQCLAARLLRGLCSERLASSKVVRRFSKESMSRVAQVIDAGLDEPIAIPALARMVNLSQSRFNVLFKATTGITCEQYILRTRLNRARDLIESGRYNIGQVAHMTGFSDHSHLTFKFTSWFGAPPKSCLPPVRTG
jgi:transcriptional regulator GlxA family with amidase domain